MIGVGLLGYKGLADGERALETTYSDQVLPLLQLKVVYDSYAVTIDNDCHNVVDGIISWEEGRRSVAAARARADRSWKSYLDTRLGGEEKRLVDDTRPLAKSVDAAMDRLADILQKEDRERLKNFNGAELPRTIEPYCSKLNELSDLQGREVAIKSPRPGAPDEHVKLVLISVGAAVGLTASSLASTSPASPETSPCSSGRCSNPGCR